jgi:hypothetical protein
MRAKEFLFEYNRDKTSQMLGQNLANTFVNGNDKFYFNQYKNSFQTPEGEISNELVVDYVLSVLERADPTPMKIYVPWFAREYIKGNLRRLEDASQFTNLLVTFDK